MTQDPAILLNSKQDFWLRREPQEEPSTER